MIWYITGGTRSGKSSYAMQLAQQLSAAPLYIATARQWDDDFRQRIDRHKQDRDDRWTSMEEEKHLSRLDLTGKVALIDCVTLWLTNFFTDLDQNTELCLQAFKEEIDLLVQKDAMLIIVSNELGMGVHASTPSGRKFTDLQGWANQYLASKADKAVFMVSGIPMILK